VLLSVCTAGPRGRILARVLHGRRWSTITCGVFALFTAFVAVLVPVSDPAGAMVVPAVVAVPSTPPDLAGTVVTEHAISIGGVSRTYRTIAPAGLSPTASALPLFVVLHGRGQAQWTAVRTTGFLPFARRGQAVLVYPDGLSRSWNAGSGCCGVAGIRGTPDTAFVAAVVADALRDLPVDPARTYLVGYSNGGKLAWSLACGHPALFAAVATYGAVPLTPCPAGRPLPSLMAVGVHDHVLPIGGDPTAHPRIPSARVAAGWLAARDRCTATPVTATEGDAVLTRFRACAPGSEVDLAVYPGADHNWPQAVTGLMWSFLSARHSPAPATRAPAAPKPALA
jgi:polyhydroxybutyrate depolymerase